MVNEAVLDWSLQRMHDVLGYKVSTTGVANRDFDHENEGHIEWFGLSRNFLLDLNNDHEDDCNCFEQANLIVVG